jgi:hypothetical protein
MPIPAAGLETAILAVQFLNAIAVAGGNMMAATQQVSLLLQKKHAAGQTLERDELLALMDQGDILEQAAIERARASLAAQEAAANPNQAGLGL